MLLSDHRMAITDICNLIQRLIQRGFAGPYLRAIASNVYFSRRHEYLWGTKPNDKTACDNKPTRVPLVMIVHPQLDLHDDIQPLDDVRGLIGNVKTSVAYSSSKSIIRRLNFVYE